MIIKKEKHLWNYEYWMQFSQAFNVSICQNIQNSTANLTQCLKTILMLDFARLSEPLEEIRH